MKKLLLITFLSLQFISANAYAQNSFLSTMQSALSNLNSKNYADAQKGLVVAFGLAKTNEQKALVLNESGLCYILQNNPSQARVEASRVTAFKDIKPETLVKTYNVMWMSYVWEKKPVQGREELEKILTIKGVSQETITETTESIGESYLKEKRYIDARTAFLKVMKDKSAPDILKMAAQMGIGRTYLGENAYTKARIQFSIVLGYNEANFPAPEKHDVPLYHIMAYMITGDSYSQEKEYQKAKESYNEALKVKGVSNAVMAKVIAKVNAKLAHNNQAMADQKRK